VNLFTQEAIKRPYWVVLKGTNKYLGQVKLVEPLTMKEHIIQHSNLEKCLTLEQDNSNNNEKER
jgi:hypothetical protein